MMQVSDAPTREELEKTLVWVTDLRQQVEAVMKGNRFYRDTTYLEVPDIRPLGVIERALREALMRVSDDSLY